MKKINGHEFSVTKNKLKRCRSRCIIFMSCMTFVFCCYSAGYSQGAKGVGKTGATFLQISPHARQVAMGGVGSGLADDVNIMRYNIAGLRHVRRRTLSFNFHPWIQDTQQGSIGLVLPYGFGVLGAEFTYFNEGKLVKLDADFQPTGGSSYSDDIMVSVGFARPVPKLGNYLSFGGGIKYIRQTLVGIASTALALDAGIHFDYNPFSLGATVQNLGLSKLKFAEEESPFPETYRAGAAAKLFQKENVNVNLAADVAWLNDQKLRYYTGGEIILGNDIALRGGYKFHDFEPNRWSLGFGLYMPMRWLAEAKARLDYAYSPMGAFEETAHRFSLIFNFGAAEPEFAEAYKANLADLDEYNKRLQEQLALAEQKMKALEDSLAARLARIQKIAAESEGKIEVEPQSREKILMTMRINFDFDKANIRPEEFPTMHQVGQILNTYPESRVHISGHTDYIGPDEYNILLSHRRVDSVMAFLTSKENVLLERFFMPVGYGEMKPVATNATAEGRFRNRRVEFLIYTLGSEPEVPEGSAIKGVEIVNDRTFRIICNGKVNYTTNVMELPHRIILDFPGIFIITDQKTFPINRGSVLRARLGYHTKGEGERFSRVVFDLQQPVRFTTEVEDNFVIVNVEQ